MEMRHPFDVYIRLWEAISNRNEICPAEEALAKLDLHFGGNPHLKTQKSTGKRDVVVLMVDEIDYLVTKKQTVLYNLFDWPSRGYSAKSPAQLIVVGISNTLNLPERLHSRLKSRIGRERCMYACYSIGESMSILEGKLGITDTKKVSHLHNYIYKWDYIRNHCSLSGQMLILLSCYIVNLSCRCNQICCQENFF